MMKSIAAAVLTAAVLAVSGTAGSAASPVVQTGDRKPFGNGHVQSWVQRDTAGNVTAFGVSFDEAALANLGAKQTQAILPLPAAPGLPFKTATVEWNPQGHPPAHVYDVPHFDFHFYTIDEATRGSIGMAGPAAMATPAPDIVPKGFVTDGGTVPMMGKHYLAASMPEFNGGKFTTTPIYGYYNGHLAFVESMVTLDYLRAKKSTSEALPQPAKFEQAGSYPAQWSIEYDPAAARYNVAFSALAAHVAARSSAPVRQSRSR